MKPLIIFSNADSLEKFNPIDNFSQRNFNLLDTYNQWLFAFCEEGNELKTITQLEAYNIYFIKDTIPEEQFNRLEIQIEDFYILRHRLPEWGLQQNGSTIIYSQHECDNHHYHTLIGILCDNTESKKHEKIVGKLFPDAEQKKESADALLIKLQLLHEIYDGKPINDIQVDKSLSKEFEKSQLKNIDKYDNSNSDHRKALIELRDALLADI